MQEEIEAKRVGLCGGEPFPRRAAAQLLRAKPVPSRTMSICLSHDACVLWAAERRAIRCTVANRPNRAAGPPDSERCLPDKQINERGALGPQRRPARPGPQRSLRSTALAAEAAPPKTCLRPWAGPAVAVAWRAVCLHPIGRMAAWRPRIGPPIGATPAPSVAGRPAADRAGRYLQSQAILAQAAGNVRLEFRLASSLMLVPATDRQRSRTFSRALATYTSTTFGRGLAPSVLVRYINRSFWGAASRVRRRQQRLL
jgi:hypothetical protein